MIPVLFICLLAVITTVPVKWAAGFADGENTRIITCFFSSILASVAAVIAFRLSSGGFTGFLIASCAVLAVHVLVLRIPARGVISFAVLALALQGVVVMSLVSFGLNLGKIAG
ncbi:MAG: hypothetical protein Q8R67_03625 [Rhodoferax sp.]|nr:hypothetical protein [Rhodoferax sp.]MDP3650753.1 hypothetical protein [Rhodoferax sp.]